LTPPTPEQLKLLIDIVNKIRMLKAWDVLPAGKAEAYARAWAEVLNFHKIQPRFYNRLYRMAIERQVYCRSMGLPVDEITADFLISQWWVLREQLHKAEIAEGRTLTENAKTQCPYCFGTGMRYKLDENGKTIGVTGICSHQNQ
jgi:hypothetical protein